MNCLIKYTTRKCVDKFQSRENVDDTLDERL